MVLADGGVRELRRGVDREFDGAVTSCESRRYFSFAAMLVVTMFRASHIIEFRASHLVVTLCKLPALLLLWAGGCLGVVTQLTVQLVPSYDVHELKYYDIPCDHFIEHFFDMLESCTSFNGNSSTSRCVFAARLELANPESIASAANPAWSADTVMCTSLQTFVPLGTKAEDLPAEAWPETCFGGGTLATLESPAPAAGVVGTSGVTRWNTSLYLVPAANIMDELQIECKQHDEAPC